MSALIQYRVNERAREGRELNATKTKIPMMEQYLSVKAQYKDAFLFYRLGDFMNYFMKMLSMQRKS